MASMSTAADSARKPIESQVVERVDPPESAPSSAPDSFQMPFVSLSLESSSSHRVHVNTGAFGAPAIVIDDSNPSDRELSTPRSAPSSRPEVSASLRPAMPKPSNRTKVPAIVVGAAALAVVAAATAWLVFLR